MEGIDIRALDLNLLLALDRLVRLRSVSAAARDLGVTQPAMSRTLQRLRDVLGDPLLVRVGRGVVPTERALALAEPAAEALRAVERVFAPPPTFDPATARGELSIALTDEAQVAYADAIVHAVWAVAPGVDVRVRPLSLASVEQARRGDLDLAITPDLGPLPATVGAPDLREFVAKRLYRRRFVVIGALDRPRPSLTLAEYAAASHVIVGADGGGRGFVDDLLAERGLRRRVAATVTSFPSAAALVASTDLLATLPEEVVLTGSARVRVYEAPLALPVLDILCVWHPRRTAEPRHRALREVVMAAITARARSWVAVAGAAP